MMDSLSGISIGHDRHYSEKVLQASKSGRTSPSEDSFYNPLIRPWAEPARDRGDARLGSAFDSVQ
jgi:hypothetical protein